MKKSYSARFISWRFYLVVIVIFLVVLGLICRLIDLTVIHRHFLQTQGKMRIYRIQTVPAFRGMIMDRKGDPLAVSAPVFSVWVNPSELDVLSPNLPVLSGLLQIKLKELNKKVLEAQKKDKVFLYLKRGLSPLVATKIKALKMRGIFLQQDYKRFYPEGEAAAHVVGFTNVDDRGQEGLELAYQDWLSGVPGKRAVLKDRKGRIVEEVQEMKKEISGRDLVLSIDRRIQYLAYRELLNGVQLSDAVSGSVVVLDTKTGEVLAMANVPSYNPNHRTDVQGDELRNRAVTDVFEPGSTIKAFSVASALDSGLYKPETVIDTSPGWLRVGRNLVRDEHEKGPMTVTHIVQISSNVGVTKMILTIPPNQLWNLLHRVGFGQPTGIGFPGERAGELANRTEWKPFALATLAFGYGISVTPLQLTAAFSVIANKGVKYPISLLKISEMPKGERVMNPVVANQMLMLLRAVVSKGGTGYPAAIPGYQVAGKTGTAIIAGPLGYKEKHYVSTFVGIAPVSNPRFIVTVVIRDPRGSQYYGGMVSGPVFKKIMEGTLRIYDIPPDDVDVLANKAL